MNKDYIVFGIIMIVVISVVFIVINSKTMEYKLHKSEINSLMEYCQHKCQEEFGCILWDDSGLFCENWKIKSPSTDLWNGCMISCGV